MILLRVPCIRFHRSILTRKSSARSEIRHSDLFRLCCRIAEGTSLRYYRFAILAHQSGYTSRRRLVAVDTQPWPPRRFNIFRTWRSTSIKCKANVVITCLPPESGRLESDALVCTDVPVTCPCRYCVG